MLGALTRRVLGLVFILLMIGSTVTVFAVVDLDKIARLAQQRYGAPGLDNIQRWRRLIQESQPLPESEKLQRVNDFFNRRISFVDDNESWGVADYWATPLEVMGRGVADCEDYSISKYFTLKHLGVSIDRMRITYVRAKIGGPYSTVTQAHMVLAYYPTPDAEPLILDNLSGEIRPASRRPDLYPVFSFNSEGLWVGPATTGNPVASSTAKLSRWRDVILRMQADGFE